MRSSPWDSSYGSHSQNGDIIASGYYDPTEHRAVYVLTDKVNSRESITLRFQSGDTLNYQKFTNSGTYTFTNNFAGTDYSYTYDVPFDGNTYYAEDRMNEGYGISPYLPEYDPRSGDYTQLFHLKTLAEPRTGVDLSVRARSLSDSGPAPEVSVYEVPAGYTFPDSFNADISALTNVTGEFTVAERGNGFYTLRSTSTAASEYFVVVRGQQKGVNTSTWEQVSLRASFTGSDVETQANSSVFYRGAEAFGELSDIIPAKYITVTKVDAKNGTGLPGAEFDIRKNGHVVAHLVTDSEGKTTSPLLPLGEYTVVETKAPVGYVRAPSTSDVNLINEGDSLVNRVVKNEAEPAPEPEPTPPPTPEQPVEPKPTPKPTPPSSKTPPPATKAQAKSTLASTGVSSVNGRLAGGAAAGLITGALFLRWAGRRKP
nr:SpaA isopeptide-forming pilin-related protein [Schaalia sp. ZJ405]